MVEYVKKKPIDKFLLFGITTFILYFLLINYQELIVKYSIKGKYYAVIPIVIAFIFSFVHGNFTDVFWKVLGIEAKKRRG